MDFLPIPPSVRQVDLGEVRKPDGSGQWICLIVAGWNLLLRGTQIPVGSLVQKQRLLNILGYTPVLVSVILINLLIKFTFNNVCMLFYY